MPKYTIHGFLQEIGSVLLEASAFPQQPLNHTHQYWMLELPNSKTVAFSTHIFETVGAAQAHQLAPYESHSHRSVGGDETSAILVIASTITPRACEHLIQTGSSYIALDQGSAYLDGTFYGKKSIPQNSQKGHRPRSWNLYALARIHILSPQTPSQQELADILNISQPTVSRTYNLLRHTLKQYDDSASTTHKSDLLRWLEFAYPSRHDLVTSWFSPAPLVQQIKTIRQVLSSADISSAVAGVVAGDMYSPWKHPQTCLVLASKVTDLEEEGFFESSPEKATMQISIPADPTRFATARWWSQESELPGIYTDPVDTYLTLACSKESDIREATQILKTKILEGAMS